MAGMNQTLIGVLTLTNATLIKTVTETEQQTKRLYKLVGDEIPLNPSGLGDGPVDETTEYFVASRVKAYDHGDWETLLFPADSDGNITSFLEFWGIRGWEPIEDTVRSFIDGRNSSNEDTSRLHPNENLLG